MTSGAAWLNGTLALAAAAASMVLCPAFGVPALLRLVFRREGKLYRSESRIPFSGPAPLARNLLAYLRDLHRAHGYFPTYLRVCLGGDRRYTLRAMAEDFLRDPDIRWLVALFAPAQWFGRKERPRPYSLPIAPGQAYAARMDFCLFNALIAECLMRHAEREPGDADACHELIDGVMRDLLAPPGGSAQGSGYLYKVSFAPRIRTPALDGLMGDWSRYYDSDSSAYALSLFARYLRLRRDDPGFLDLRARAERALAETPYPRLLETVFRPAAEFTLPIGRAFLPEGAQAFLTYFTDGANDADPVVNMDILEALARNWDAWKVPAIGGLTDRIRAALEYIRALAGNGSLFEPPVNQYYTAPACAFLWKRYHDAFMEMDPAARAAFDPEGATAAIDARIEAYWSEYAARDPGFSALADFDLALLAAAFPGKAELRARLNAAFSSGIGPGCREFFCAVYPVKVIYGSPALLAALALAAGPHV